MEMARHFVGSTNNSRNWCNMKEEDVKALMDWLCGHGYYVGSHAVAEALRKLADAWDD